MSGGESEHSGYYFNEGRVDVEQSKRDEIHPYVQALNYNNVESCTALEHAAFPLQEAASREKVSCNFPSPPFVPSPTVLLQKGSLPVYQQPVNRLGASHVLDFLR